jgi:hypothetical protein
LHALLRNGIGLHRRQLREQHEYRDEDCQAYRRNGEEKFRHLGHREGERDADDLLVVLVSDADIVSVPEHLRFFAAEALSDQASVFSGLVVIFAFMANAVTSRGLSN